jgi:hypothetical protein
MTYSNVVSIFADIYIYIYMTYITTYPQVVPVHLMLHGQCYICYENVFISYRRHRQNIHRFSRPKCTIMVSHMTDMQPLPHDRDCPQASLVLWERVRDSHLPSRGKLPSYLFIGASLQNSKLHKVNIESKTQLACHMLRLL